MGQTEKSVMQNFVQTASSKPSPHKIKIKEAEIKLCGFLAEHNIPFLAMDHLSPLLSSIFTDSQIAKELAVRRTKSKAIIQNVIGQTHKKDIANILKTEKFSVLTDESTDIAALKSACIVIRFYNKNAEKVETLLWELASVFDCEENNTIINQGTAAHLYENIIHTFRVQNIPLENIIGFASDGCNVMMGEFNSVASRFKEQCPGIVIMKCICHSLHLCSSQACKTLPRICEDLARNIYGFFKVSLQLMHTTLFININFYFLAQL